jgi:beta-galactosidase
MKYLFNNGWSFLETKAGTCFEDAKQRKSEFVRIELPHDWLIYDSLNLYRDGTGWYKRSLVINEVGGRYSLCFDGVYMDCAVYVNETKVFEWKYGYSAFEVDITQQLHGGINTIYVGVNHISPNSRWYSGAGIYRNVQIKNTDETYLAEDGIYVSTYKKDNKRIVHIEAEVCGRYKNDAFLDMCILDADEKEVQIIPYNSENSKSPTADSPSTYSQNTTLYVNDYEIVNPHIWDIDDTYLYTLEVCMNAKGIDKDECRVRFGIRDVLFDPDKGFFLNGRSIKLNGVCEHHDLGALGAAFNKCAMKRKLKMLKEMGVNALRTAHNMPAPELLDLADEMGILVMSEAFDMWWRSKTEFDYARFFEDWHERDIASWVRQDRNHPCVIMWSIGNEIYDMHADPNAPEMTKHLSNLVKRHDPFENALTTFGSNFLPWEGAQKCADVIKLVGYNYSEKYYKEHHEKHPDWVIFGSETASIVSSRGVYKFPLEYGRLSDVDEQCSALGNSITSWGAKSLEKCVCLDRDMEFSQGQFLWTGFDYIGEPTPYHTKNSYFGCIDTAGFAKDAFFVYMSAWVSPQKHPMVHVFPYWDFNPGQIIDVRVCSNEDEVELFINGRSLGREHLTHKQGSGQHIIADYKVPYEKGILEAVCYDADGNITARDIQKSFGDSHTLHIIADTDTVKTGSGDLIFAEIETLDADGCPVRNAADRVFVNVTGQGRLIGLDNGDSTDYDSYKGTSKRLFNGKLLAVIAPSLGEGDIVLSVSAKGVKECKKVFKAIRSDINISCFDKEVAPFLEGNRETECLLGKKDDVPVRKLEIKAKTRTLDSQTRQCEVSVEIFPSNATDREIIYSAVSDRGVPVNIVSVLPNATGATLKARGDGSFRLRCMSKSGTQSIRVISELEFSVTGIGPAFLDPYGFISGSDYSYSEGEVSNGNEMGFATAIGERTLVTFDNVDFGNTGSDEITVPVFALDAGPHIINVYDSIPGKGGELLGECVYQKPSIWNVYQEETWQLSKKLCGVHSLSFEFFDKVHVKGFSFKQKNRAFMNLYASEADEIYGDNYIINGNYVEKIGNNVTLCFSKMDFGESGISGIYVKGRAKDSANTVHVRFFDEKGSVNSIIEFPKCGEYTQIRFDIEKITGTKDVVFVFMPGSCFDFESFRFIP